MVDIIKEVINILHRQFEILMPQFKRQRPLGIEYPIYFVPSDWHALAIIRL
jgi:hypothetical protein